jgi:hypothetical protein
VEQRDSERECNLNDASRWRLAIARKVAPIFAANPRVRAVMCAGSTSRGCADAYSDIEINVVWESPPTDDERMAPIALAEGVFWELDPYDEERDTWMEEWGFGNLKMDMRNRTVAGMERILADVLDRSDSSLFKQEALSAVQHAIPLSNAPLIEGWQARLDPYPEQLGHAMVRAHLYLYEWGWWLEQVVSRGDWPLVYNALSEATLESLAMLVGLNGIYHPGNKWMRRLIGELRIAPPELAKRIDHIFRIGATEPLEAGHELCALVLEVYDLIDAHMSIVDTGDARERFLRDRGRFDAPPSGNLCGL